MKIRHLALVFFLAVPVLLVWHPANAQVQQDIVISSLVGSYKVEGRNPDGSSYKGSLEISVNDNVANFNWAIGSQKFRGQGSLIGNVLVVNWGDAAPVIYTIDLDGNLTGTWKNGRASERAVRK